ncbi:hypothetical protein QNN03_30765 [Streptomyces sp. GXMU-J15]|uniref:Uncharacterized protein n=1 Tax=Streptomyces fuscus TaxID=3048495 RepID=A0ABT7J955_9ACTN|nr:MULTISPECIES: hypothetical protein [Streptomyces]MDL2080834.1 hypothetical protein [Streptomyces fuscus]SBT94141.1 hypothetical protein GA0115233_108010 [Streptomyces sp. DI166]
MSDYELPPDGRPVDIYLGLLRSRMDTEEFLRLLDVVEPVLRAIEERRLPPSEIALEGEGAEALPLEIRDEAALVIAAAVTGRLDNEVVEIDLGETGSVRLVTDAATAADPVRLGEIATYIQERRHDDEELRGIAAVSGLPTDF